MPLNTDPSANVPVIVRAKKDIGFTITFPSAPTGVWQIVWSRDEAGLDPIMTNTSGNGFVIAGSVLTFYVAYEDNLLEANQDTWFRVSQTVSDSSILAFIGKTTVRP